jgi:hypothetical protein
MDQFYLIIFSETIIFSSSFPFGSFPRDQMICLKTNVGYLPGSYMPQYIVMLGPYSAGWIALSSIGVIILLPVALQSVSIDYERLCQGDKFSEVLGYTSNGLHKMEELSWLRYYLNSEWEGQLYAFSTDLGTVDI